MSTNFNVNVNGKPVQITSGEKIDDIKKKFGDKADVIFEGVDVDNNGVLNAGEVDKLKTNLNNNNFTVQVADDGKTPRGAYNSAIQQLKSRYTADDLKENFKADDTHTVGKGETLYTIAKKQLEEEGILTDFRSINHRISQIAVINNINDVNNIEVGTKLITKLTDDAIKSVKENDNDSVKAFTGESASLVTGEEWTRNGVKKRKANGDAEKQDPIADDGVKSDYKKQRTFVDGKTSTIAVTRNGLNMGKGVPVDKDGNELKNFKDPKYKAGGSYMKYTNANGEVMYQTVYSQNSKTEMLRGVKISAPTLEEAKAKEKSILDTAAKIKTAPTNETAEAKATRMATNLAALKELVAMTGGNEQVIKNVAEKLRGDDYVDRKSDDYKAFVQDLLLTRNADVVSALTPKDGDKVDMSVVEYDRTSHETLAGMYQEIREKEKAGEKLSADEIKLKDALVNTQYEDGFKIEADEANHVNEKYQNYGTDGRLFYHTFVGNIDFWASTEKTLDEFVNKFKTADTDEKKVALFKEYANTKDVELARCLMTRAKDLKASDEDIKTVINANGMEVLAKLDRSANSDWSDDIKNTMLARIKNIYTKDKGNLENAEWLSVANDWINNLPENQQEAARTEIAETYFEKNTTKDEDGNDQVEYTFKPTRRPTYEEMEGLHNVAQNEGMRQALVNYTKIEDMGKGQYNEVTENEEGGRYTVSHYADMVENMSDKNEVLDFIDNKIATDRNYHVPYDKILEKFPDDKDVKDKLLSYVDVHSTISDENRLTLVKTYMKEENGKITLDKTKLPKGTNAVNVLAALPTDCKTGEAEKYFKAVLKELNKGDLETIKQVGNRNPKAVKARLAELVKSNMGDKAFIQEVCKLDNSITPYQALYEVDANKAKWDDKTKQVVFEKIFNGRIKIKDKQKYLDGAVKNGLIQKVTESKFVTTGVTVSKTSVIDDSVKDRYIIGNNVYLTDGWNDVNKNNKMDEKDTISLLKMSKSGYDNGAKLYGQLKGAGSGDTAKMLKGEGNYKNFVTADNVAGLIQGFNDKSPNEGVMQYIANEFFKIPQAKCNVIPNKLMEKARTVDAELGQNNSAYFKIADGKAYKDLAKFVKGHQNTTKGYSEDEGKQLDQLINDLKSAISLKS